MNTAPLSVTIGLPFSDQPLHQFKAAVRSVFAQDVGDWRLILFADGPSENVDWARAITDDRVEIIVGERSRGLAVGLNQLAVEARTPYLFRMDADDVMHPSRVRVLRDFFSRHPEIDLVGTRAWMIDQTGIVHGRFAESHSLPSSQVGYLRSNAFTHPTVAGKTEWFRANPYDEALRRSQDKALWLRSSGHSQFAKLDDETLFYRVDSRLSSARQSHSSKYDRALLWQYGRSVSAWAAVKQIALSHAKQRAFWTLLRVGQRDRLYRRKFESVPAAQLCGAQAVLDSSSSVPVPGWLG